MKRWSDFATERPEMAEAGVDVDDELAASGRAVQIDDPEVDRIVYETYTATGAVSSNHTLFELLLERVLHAKYGPRPSWPPVYTRWSASSAS